MRLKISGCGRYGEPMRLAARDGGCFLGTSVIVLVELDWSPSSSRRLEFLCIGT